MCLKANSSKVKWFIDSGCSRHMRGDKSLFNQLEDHHGSHVTFGDNSRFKIEGISSIGNSSHIYISDVYYVNDLKHNLLSIFQLCDKGYSISFNEHECNVVDKNTKSKIFTGKKKWKCVHNKYRRSKK